MRSVLSATALFACIGGASVLAQDAAPPRETGRTLAWSFVRMARDIADYKATTAEMTAVEANMVKLVDILKATRLLSPPLGYDIRFTGTLNPSDPSLAKKVNALSYSVDFSFLDYLRSPSNPAFKSPFANQGLSFHINDPYRTLDASGFRDPVFMRKSWSDDEGEFWIEPPADDFSGLRFYRAYDMLAVTRAGASLWKPVTTERFLGKYLEEKRQDAAQAEAKLAAARKTYEAAKAAEMTARRQKEIDAARAGKGGDAEAKRLEAMYGQTLEQLKAQTSPARGNPKDLWYFGPKQALTDAEALAGSLSAAARQSPACVTGYEVAAERWDFKLVPDGTRGCRRIVEVDLGLFDNRLPRTAIQLIVVGNLAACEQILKGPDEIARSWPGGCKGTVELARQVDWKKVAALLGR
jgi:hypothetical protein